MHATVSAPNDGAAEKIDALIWEADPSTLQFTYVSRGAERLLGYTLERWLAEPAFWIDLLHPDDRQAAIAECRTAVEECQDHTLEYRVRSADGRTLWIRDIVRVVCDGAGRAVALRGAMVDITARRTAAPGVDDTDRYYRALIEHALDLIVVFDRDGLIRFESPSARRILGVAPADRVGRPIFELVHPDDVARLRTVFAGSLATGRPTTTVEFRCMHADGSWLTLEAVGRRFVDEHGDVVGIVNCRDISERRRMQERLVEAQKMESIGRVTSAIAHDFNNVLALVLGNAEMALDDCGEALRAPLTQIKEAVALGSKLTSQLLAFGRPAAWATAVVPVDDTLADMQGLLQRLAGPAVLIDMQLGAPMARVRLAHGALEQSAMNFAANAGDAMPRGGRFRVSTSIAGGTRVAIQFADNGAGMDESVRARMFEPYFTTKAGRGSGIGLATVYRIVQEAGGSIEVESAPGRGTRICIQLPLAS